MIDSKTRKALELGLLRFPPAGEFFPARGGGRKLFLTDTRGAGVKLALRKLIVEEMRERLSAFNSFDVVGGLAKSGTMWGAWLSWICELPFANVLLSGPRASGLQREVEGDVTGKRVLLIDNWIQSGSTIRKGQDVIQRAGGTAEGVLVIVRFKKGDLGIPVEAIWELEELLNAAVDEGSLSRETRDNILNAEQKL